MLNIIYNYLVILIFWKIEYDLIYSLTDYNYRYLEKTIINNSQCYKFALSKQIDDNSQEQYIFYINI